MKPKPIIIDGVEYPNMGSKNAVNIYTMVNQRKEEEKQRAVADKLEVQGSD